MNKNLSAILITLFLAIALIYPTYAIFASMTEDVRHSMEPLQNIPDTMKQGFKAGGWDVDAETSRIIDTTTSRNQLAFMFLAIVEMITALLFGIAYRMSLKT